MAGVPLKINWLLEATASKFCPVTTITGRVLNTEDEPLESVIITLDGQNTTTDAAGNFVLPNVLEGTARVAFVDGRPVQKNGEEYPIVEAMLDILPNQPKLFRFLQIINLDIRKFIRCFGKGCYFTVSNLSAACLMDH